MRWKSAKRRAASGALAGGLAAVLAEPPLVIWHVGIGNGDDLKALKQTFPHAYHVGVDPLWPTTASRLDKMFQFAASSCNRQRVEFHEAGVSSSLHPVAKATGKRFVETATLDRLNRALPQQYKRARPCIVCFDCEGAELQAIAGGQKLLQRASLVTAELVYHGTKGAPNWPTPTEICKALEACGLYLLMEVGRIWPRPGTDGIFLRA